MSQVNNETTQLVSIEDELRQQALQAAASEANTATGQFFGLRSGILSWNGNPLPGNQIVGIILDSIHEISYYKDKFDGENKVSPTAFALGRDADKLVWHENSEESFIGKLCKDDDVCQWGSSDSGRGKAARETRRLAIIPAGTVNNKGDVTLFDDLDEFKNSTIGFLRLPVTSVANYASYVKQIAGALHRPPHGVITRIRAIPDTKTQFKIVFEVYDSLGHQFLPTAMARHEEARALIEFPYPKNQPTDDTTPKKARKY